MSTPLTAYEMKLVVNPEMLLAKNRIIQKVYELFGGLAEEYQHIIETAGLCNYTPNSAKISRGENYNGLPYLVLDYPRQFDKQDVLAIRTFFWWGNFFSITLHLSGRYQQKLVLPIENTILQGVFDNWFLSSSDDPWQHHFGADNFKPVVQGEHYQLSPLPFVKLAKKIPLEKWDNVELFFVENFYFLVSTLCVRLQFGETNL